LFVESHLLLAMGVVKDLPQKFRQKILNKESFNIKVITEKIYKFYGE
jgi:hypothetical protein